VTKKPKDIVSNGCRELQLEVERA